MSTEPGSIGKAALAGAVATFVAVTAGYWLPGIGLLRIDFPTLNGNVIMPVSTASAAAWMIGAAQTFGIGALLGVIYLCWIRDRLPGEGPTRGLVWGALVGVVAGLTVLPLVYGGGVFGLAWAPQAPVALAAWFIVWGAALGITEDALGL